MQRVQPVKSANEVAGRLGEDFGIVEMTLPGALGNTLLTWLQVIASVTVIVYTSPFVCLVLIVLIPIAAKISIRDSDNMLSATQQVAQERHILLEILGYSNSSGLISHNDGIRAAAGKEFQNTLGQFESSSIGFIESVAKRRRHIAEFSVAIVVLGILGSISISNNEIVSRSLLVYVSYSVAGAVPGLLLTLQDLMVNLSHFSRLRNIGTFANFRREYPLIPNADIEFCWKMINRASITRLSGDSGIGKTSLLMALSDCGDENSVRLIPRDLALSSVSVGELWKAICGGTLGDRLPSALRGVDQVMMIDIPFALRQRLLLEIGALGKGDIVLYDETLSGVESLTETIEYLQHEFRSRHKRMVFSAHSNEHPRVDCELHLV
jgi:hypothetical protein